VVTQEWTGVTVLGPDECWDRLASAEVGRLAVVVHAEPEIFPVNYAVDGRTIVFRTAEGTKLAAVAMNAAAAFEVDGYDAETGQAWSVVLKGIAHRLEHFDEIYAADELPLYPWQGTPKQFYVRIRHTSVTGREFTRVRGPARAD
jgi:nitroimidazol reductase NimA-like FMN-containing flavoprotein (pyridoxamine 5'-phosphate oxidase superfamily)